MCFSASASFIAGSGLILGGAAIRRYRSVHRYQQMVAAIPFLFGVHQFSEGVVWLGVYGAIPQFMQTIAIYFFSFIAFVFWPIYIPFAMSSFEQFKFARYARTLQIAGLVVAAYYFWCFTFYSQLHLEVVCEFNECSSLAYVFRLPYFEGAINYAYGLVTVLPFFLTTNRRVRWLVGPGFLIAFSVGTYMSAAPEAPSVWCFFAGIASLFIFLAFKTKTRIDTTR